MKRKLIVLLVMVSILIANSAHCFSKDEKLKEIYEKFKNVNFTNSIDPNKLLGEFELGTNTTQIQREKIKKDIIGKVVRWKGPVYEVSRNNEYFQITISNTLTNNGVIVNILPYDEEDVKYIYSLSTGDRIEFVGVISDTFLRNIVIEPAVLYRSFDQLQLEYDDSVPGGEGLKIANKNQKITGKVSNFHVPGMGYFAFIEENGEEGEMILGYGSPREDIIECLKSAVEKENKVEIFYDENSEAISCTILNN